VTPPICYGIKEAAAALCVCTKTIRDLIDAGELPTVKLPSVKYAGERGKRILILVDDLKAFAEKHKVQS
jgi:Helix-turn-helix domain